MRKKFITILTLFIAVFLGFNSCHTYRPPTTAPDLLAARITGKIVQGAAPTFEPGEDPAKSYFIVTPAYVIYFDFLQYENRELKLTVEKLQKIIAGKK